MDEREDLHRKLRRRFPTGSTGHINKSGTIIDGVRGKVVIAFISGARKEIVRVALLEPIGPYFFGERFTLSPDEFVVDKPKYLVHV